MFTVVLGELILSLCIDRNNNAFIVS